MRRRGKCPAEESLLECARQLGVGLVNLCGGVGTCGRCKVQVLEGDVSDVTSSEREALSAEELAGGYRLACQAFPRSDCALGVPPESLTAPQRTQVEGQEVPVEPEPVVRQYTLALSQPSLGNDVDPEDLRDDETRVLDGLREQHGVEADRVDVDVLRALSPRLREEAWHVRVGVREGEVIHVGPAPGALVGLAVDLGTTKVAGYLIELDSGETLTAAGVMNPQIAYGEDVVSRVTRAQRSSEEAARMREVVVDALNELASALCEEAGTTRGQIGDAVVVANTAMHHLFLGLPVRQLARAPYVPAVRGALDVKARDAGLRLAHGASVHLLPNVAGYVGADHVAMLLATEMARAEGVVLALDIGTNTEVCLARDGRLRSTSCASGPAFEGAHIRHGMRAAEGVIEYLRLSEDKGGYRVRHKTIGDAPPAGLCGSGILDALAEVRRVGIVDAGGRMKEGPGVRTSNGEREFVLVDEEASGAGGAITITQKDVRELQLAKGAMRAGIQLLLEAEGLPEEAIDEVIIAGAFGSYIDVTSAIAIGMLPDLPLERFRQVGNAAGMGAKLALISRQKRDEARGLAERTRYLELSTTPAFKRRFAEATQLG
ncbi:MAG: ASKHA domain-containing protein [Chloroflexota bacterium]|nr:ASKHA domain-containing protein [Chloroflexota bacterium]